MLRLLLFLALVALGRALSPRDVEELLSHVEPEYAERCKTILEGGAFTFSQSWQDWILFHNTFKHKTAWGAGTYLDIGTNDPVVISNTIFFDKCLGWKGLCVEMQETHHANIRAKRSCKLVPDCVLGVAGSASSIGSVATPGGTGRMCRGIEEVLQAFDFTRVPDLVSIDIEGIEPLVFGCWNWTAVAPHAVLIETNKARGSTEAQLRARELRMLSRVGQSPASPLSFPAQAANVADIDLYFHRHGYANVETFLAPDADTGVEANGASQWLDNLYVRSQDVPVTRPPAPHPSWHEWPGAGFKNAWTCSQSPTA